MHEIHTYNVLAATMVGLAVIAFGSLIREPARQRLMAIVLAGAGGVYFNGGLGVYEYPLSLAILACAYLGLRYYPAIGVGWLLHTASDVLHHAIGQPIISFVPTSSAECAVCDAVMAVWFFLRAPSVFGRKRFAANEASSPP